MSDVIEASVFSLPVGDATYSLLKVPRVSPVDTRVRNICMVDVSGSMSNIWPFVLLGWNDIIAPKLNGVTGIYTFGTEVKHRREGVLLKNEDFDCASTNLTGALKLIREKIDQSPELQIRVFLITDGQHNAPTKEPSSEIALMKTPMNKTVEVYLLGIGNYFPVEYSVDIRSRLHNGSATCPTLFWIREDTQFASECENILEEISKGNMKVQLSMPAKTLPLADDAQNYGYAGEYMFYDMNPVQLVKKLKLSNEEGSNIALSIKIENIDPKVLVDNIFKQWISILVQRHRKRLNVPLDVFDIMKKSFANRMNEHYSDEKDDLKSRLLRKEKSRLMTDFQTQMNQSYKMISVENKFGNEIELAEAILKTTVQSKYDTKLLDMKGHGDEAWNLDKEAFKKIYSRNIDEINGLPEPEIEDCCRVLLCSFVSDLKDSSFLELLELNKMDFLTNVSITGIPAFAPVKDSTQINSWTLSIENICTSPFEILSQRSMETCLAVNGTNIASKDKDITLQADNPNSKYNIIVPIIPKKYCKTLKTLVRTNLFSMVATFSILKNPLIIDNWCHIAALGCVWMKTIEDYSISKSRPDFIKRRIDDVVGTASLYLDRPSVARYVKALVEKLELAIMTE